MITSLLHNPEVHQKFMAEVDPLMDRVKDDIVGKMSYEDVEDLEYVKMCYQESMRIEAPAAGTGTGAFSKDVTINGVDFFKGEAFYVMPCFVHQDPL